MVYLENGTKIGTVARIKEKIDNSILITYNANGPKETWVILEKDFSLNEGDLIAIYMQYVPLKKRVYALAVAKEGQYFSVDNHTVFLAKSIQGKGTVRFITKGMDAMFHEVALKKQFNPGRTTLCVATGLESQITEKGKELQFYKQCIEFCEFKMKEKDSFKDVLITVGCYENHPTKVSELLNVPESEKKRVLEWMSFAADSWNPPNIGNLWEQKAAITALLEKERA